MPLPRLAAADRVAWGSCPLLSGGSASGCASAQRFSLQRAACDGGGFAAVWRGIAAWLGAVMSAAGAGRSATVLCCSCGKRPNGREEGAGRRAASPRRAAAPKSHRPGQPDGPPLNPPNPGENLRLTQMLAGLQTIMRRSTHRSTNFGVRYDRDCFRGNPNRSHAPDGVLHEPVLEWNRRCRLPDPHPRDEGSVSYHQRDDRSLMARVVEALEPHSPGIRCPGNSAFHGSVGCHQSGCGRFGEQFRPASQLETPIDGEDRSRPQRLQPCPVDQRRWC